MLITLTLTWYALHILGSEVVSLILKVSYDISSVILPLLLLEYIIPSEAFSYCGEVLFTSEVKIWLNTCCNVLKTAGWQPVP